MSVNYYLACKKCDECIHIAQDGLGGWTFYSGEPDCMEELGSWLGEQVLRGCRPTLMPEWDVEDMNERLWKSTAARR